MIIISLSVLRNAFNSIQFFAAFRNIDFVGPSDSLGFTMSKAFSARARYCYQNGRPSDFLAENFFYFSLYLFRLVWEPGLVKIKKWTAPFQPIYRIWSKTNRSISWEMHFVGFRGIQREKGQGHNSQVIRYLTSFRSRWSHWLNCHRATFPSLLYITWKH